MGYRLESLEMVPWPSRGAVLSGAARPRGHSVPRCARPSECPRCRRFSWLRRPLPPRQPGSERLHGLRIAARFENSMQDLLLNSEGFAALMGRIMAFECELMRLAARQGFHGITLPMIGVRRPA